MLRNKLVYYLIFLLFVYFLGIPDTYALSCKDLIGEVSNSNDTAYWLQWILDIMKYVAIIALLVLSTVDFIQALPKDDKSIIIKTAQKTFKRFIFVVLIFFLPIIINLIMAIFGITNDCGIG